ncbi:MAG: hypothetical protein IT423_11885 [Pirellulaceae bacterium]|nr:hypothetical protein [Pirellulaceae bacterium]
MANTGCLHRNRACNNCNGPLGCRPCAMGWQRGGTDYQRHLSFANHAHQGGDTGQAGPAAAQVAYPYYTTRGPRDFLLNNPPTIGR